MNILTEPVPETVNIGGVEVPIHWDFRVSIRFEELMDEDIPDEEKAQRALELYYPHIPEDRDAAVDRILWFYSGGEEPEEANNGSGQPVERIYSYTHDGAFIYAAFLDQYGIDLQETDHLHWWKFRAMFAGLKSDNRIVEIMGYREIEITPQMSKEQKQYYRKMKKLFALPLPKSEREKLSAIEEALLNGGDVSALL